MTRVCENVTKLMELDVTGMTKMCKEKREELKLGKRDDRTVAVVVKENGVESKHQWTKRIY
jgi:hypothetical protein